MLMIRLQRIGRKHEPAYRLVLTDSKNSTKSGKFLEILGNYDARRGEKSEFKGERISHWMSVGAQVSDTVHNLLVDKKIVSGKKINTLPKKSAPKPEVKEEVKEVKTEIKPEVKDEPVVPEVETEVSEAEAEIPTEVSNETPAESPEEVVA